MASPSVFFDANILLYTDDGRVPSKQKIAVELIEQHLRQKTGALSLQVLGEYFYNARRKMNIDVVTARQRTIFFSKLLRLQPTIEDVLGAIDLHQLHHFRYWDAAIVRAAIRSGCRTLFSEDMQHGYRVDSLEIVNPFL